MGASGDLKGGSPTTSASLDWSQTCVKDVILSKDSCLWRGFSSHPDLITRFKSKPLHIHKSILEFAEDFILSIDNEKDSGNN